MTAEFLLTKFQPYPGDKLRKRKHRYSMPPYERFTVKQLPGKSGDFRIKDEFCNFKVTINKTFLANPKFNLAHWYARKHAHALNIAKPTRSRADFPPQLENPVALVTRSLLQSGIHSHFPNVKVETWTDTRFFVYLKDYGSTTYVIVDDDLDLKLEIELEFLENPKFNLIRWYLGHARTVGAFNKKYLKGQRGTYQNKPERSCAKVTSPCICRCGADIAAEELSIMRNVLRLLGECAPYPGDDKPAVVPRCILGRHYHLLG